MSDGGKAAPVAKRYVRGQGDFGRVVITHIVNMSIDMQTSGLPFEDSKNVWSGLTGFMYGLPALATPFWWERCLWLLQAILSVLADYTYVNDMHVVHGIDRIFATYNTIRIILLVASTLPLWTVLFALIPLSFYYRGAMAKKKNRVETWIVCHMWWHITGGILCAAFTYIIRYVYRAGDPAYLADHTTISLRN
mmetsp:Transcript_30053/g.56177  ORF Transcript_30053/g.56177 Transcript_30053/m.56177 type:complete len:193 (-) Transcript_30053:233-811(-)